MFFVGPNETLKIPDVVLAESYMQATTSTNCVDNSLLP
jgi:hypothetical protein